MIVFNDYEIDLLKEYINISFGKATSNIAILVDKFAKLDIPKIEFIDPRDLDEYIAKVYGCEDVTKDCIMYSAGQVFNGELSGETLFLMDETSAKELTNEFYPVTQIDENFITDTVLEVNNILSVSSIGTLSEVTNLSSQFLAPTLRKVSDYKYIEKSNIAHYPMVIAISTILKFESSNINGFLLILPTLETTNKLQSHFDIVLKESISNYVR